MWCTIDFPPTYLTFFLLIFSVIPVAIDSESILKLYDELNPNVRLESQLQVWKYSLAFLLANFYSINA